MSHLHLIMTKPSRLFASETRHRWLHILCLPYDMDHDPNYPETNVDWFGIFQFLVQVSSTSEMLPNKSIIRSSLGKCCRPIPSIEVEGVVIILQRIIITAVVWAGAGVLQHLRTDLWNNMYAAWKDQSFAVGMMPK